MAKKWCETQTGATVTLYNSTPYQYPSAGKPLDRFALLDEEVGGPGWTMQEEPVYTDGKDFCFQVEEELVTDPEKATKLKDQKPAKFDKLVKPEKDPEPPKAEK
jgi:hypothetical protein